MPGLARAQRLGGQAAMASASRVLDLQPRIGRLQQGLAYTQQLGASLQALKSGLSQTLAQGQPSSPQALQAQLDQLSMLWQIRQRAGAGQLDSQLQAVPDGESARQVFRLRGLDRSSLSMPAAETLYLSLPGQGRSVSIYLDGQGLLSHTRALRQGLSSLGVQLDGVDHGELMLSVPESDWPLLRDGLTMRGGGKRYPNGELVRAPLEAQAEVFSPQQWQVDDMASQRRCLAQVVEAQGRLNQAQGKIQQALQQSAAALPPTDTQQTAQVEAFVEDFAARSPQDGVPLDYERLSEMAPALLGLRRSQVEQLLGSPA